MAKPLILEITFFFKENIYLKKKPGADKPQSLDLLFLKKYFGKTE